MQPIHIETLKSSIAADEVCHILRKGSASWLVWSANDEGYLMAPASSATARSVRRYYPETIAGEFMPGSSADVIAGAMKCARQNAGERGASASLELRARRAAYKRERRALARMAA
jgi:hypothetical protein